MKMKKLFTVLTFVVAANVVFAQTKPEATKTEHKTSCAKKCSKSCKKSCDKGDKDCKKKGACCKKAPKAITN